MSSCRVSAGVTPRGPHRRRRPCPRRGRSRTRARVPQGRRCESRRDIELLVDGERSVIVAARVDDRKSDPAVFEEFGVREAVLVERFAHPGEVPSKEWYVCEVDVIEGHETDSYLVCRLLLEKKKKTTITT